MLCIFHTYWPLISFCLAHVYVNVNVRVYTFHWINDQKWNRNFPFDRFLFLSSNFPYKFLSGEECMQNTRTHTYSMNKRKFICLSQTLCTNGYLTYKHTVRKFTEWLVCVCLSVRLLYLQLKLYAKLKSNCIGWNRIFCFYSMAGHAITI